MWWQQVKNGQNAQYRPLDIIPQIGKVWYKMMIVGFI